MNDPADLCFKRFIYSNEGVEALKKLYLAKDDSFFSPSKYKSQSEKIKRWYLSNSDFIKWKDTIKNLAKPVLCEKSFSKINEKRSGEYSNATLYSSSRMAMEIFGSKDNCDKLVQKIFGTKIEDIISVCLEKKLPFSLLGGGTKPEANMDVVIETINDILYIECKMKEPYSLHKPIFSGRYEKTLNDLGFTTTEIGNKNVELGVFLLGTTKGSPYYYKQTICHLLGMKAEKTQKTKHFLNFTFDPRGLTPDKKINARFERYLADEKAIMGGDLGRLFKQMGVQYDGVFNQNFEKI